MKKITRRGLLRASAGIGGLALAEPWCRWGLLAAEQQGKVGQPQTKFPVVARQRLAVATWPFRAEIEAATNEYRDKKRPGLDLREFCAGVRKKFDVPGVEPLSTHFPSTDEHYLKNFRKSLEKTKVHVVNIPVDNEYSFYDADAEVRRKAIEQCKRWVDIAVVLDAPSLRTSIAAAKNSKPNVNVAAASLREVVEYAANKNVLINLENDNPVSEDPVFLVEVLGTVSHPYLRALPDFCNSMAAGNDEKFNSRALAMLFPRAYNICHVKDSEVGDHGKVYRINVRQAFQILRAAQFRGYLSMEFEGEGDPYEGTKKLIAASLQWLT